MKKTIWDHLLLIILILLLIIASSCQYEEYEPYIKPNNPKEIKDYKVTFDKIRHYSKVLINFSSLNYYSECGFDTTSAIADFDLDGDDDIFLAPQCTDGEERQPEMIFFENVNGKFIKSDWNIINNIGLMSGTRQTIIGDYNGDKIPDLFFAAHNGHGLGGGVPSIMLSTSEGFKYKEFNIQKGWYSFASSGDIDGDKDLDIILSGGEYGIFINDGLGNFQYTPNFVKNYSEGIGVTSLIDINKDGQLDLFFRNYNEHKVILNSYGSFDYNNSINLSHTKYFFHSDNSADVLDLDMDIQDRVFYDIDNDGDLDIVFASIPHNDNDSPIGFFYNISILINNSLLFEDKTKDLIDESRYERYIEWLRFYDLDNNGFVELFENQKKDNFFYKEWNGSKFIEK